MGKQINSKFEGTTDGIIGYKLNGEWLVRAKGNTGNQGAEGRENALNLGLAAGLSAKIRRRLAHLLPVKPDRTEIYRLDNFLRNCLKRPAADAAYISYHHDFPNRSAISSGIMGSFHIESRPGVTVVQPPVFAGTGNGSGPAYPALAAEMQVFSFDEERRELLEITNQHWQIPAGASFDEGGSTIAENISPGTLIIAAFGFGFPVADSSPGVDSQCCRLIAVRTTGA
ncbi:MAG: hypothetical protein JWQ27_2806 [Ferruginibacter sp.]|nr:hypothetical protein [Ferruginibacter sp.]